MGSVTIDLEDFAGIEVGRSLILPLIGGRLFRVSHEQRGYRLTQIPNSSTLEGEDDAREGEAAGTLPGSF